VIVVVEIDSKLEDVLLDHDYVMVHIKDHYYPDGVGTDYTVLYPLSIDGMIEDKDLFMDYVRGCYHLIMTFHISYDEIIEIYRRNKS